MKIMDLQNTLLTYKKPLAVFVAVCILLCSLGLNFVQSYTAEVYIEYLGNNAVEGLAADWETGLNPHEITNAAVVRAALERMGEAEAEIGKIEKDIEITPVISSAEEEKYDAWIDSFDNYMEDTEEGKKFPVHYRVSFKSKKGSEYATKMLSALIYEYRQFYAERYGYANDVATLSDEAVLGYDYFETALMLEEKIENDKEVFKSIEENDFEYRSPATGYTMSDLIGMYDHISETYLASVYENILSNGIARDAQMINTAFAQKADDAEMERDKSNRKADTQLELMNIYSKKNKNYLWDAAYNHDEESEQVREDTERDRNYSLEKSVYDQMILDYVTFSVAGSNFDIDAKYNHEYKTIFKDTDNETGEAIGAELKNVCDKLNKAHRVAVKTLADYNNYKSAHYISEITGVSVSKTMSEMIYYVATIILALGLGVVAVIFTELKKKGKI